MPVWVGRAFQLSAFVNVAGILLFGQFFGTALAGPYPALFSPEGQAGILLWGLAYLAVAPHWSRLPGVCLVFSLEKLFYAVTWFVWLSRPGPRLAELLAADPLTGVFYAIYGPNDLAFAAVFAYAFARARTPSGDPS